MKESMIMRKLTVFLLLVSLCLGLCACGGTGDPDHDYILHLLEQEDYDMAIHVIEGLRDGGSGGSEEKAGEGRQEAEGPQQQAAVPGSNARQQQYDQPPEFNGTDWIYHIFLENMLDEDISLEALVITDFLQGSETGWSVLP